jgi:hypothetical protein
MVTYVDGLATIGQGKVDRQCIHTTQPRNEDTTIDVFVVGIDTM